MIAPSQFNINSFDTLINDVKKSSLEIMLYVKIPDIQDILSLTQKILNTLVSLIQAQGPLFDSTKQELILLLYNIRDKSTKIQSLINVNQ